MSNTLSNPDYPNPKRVAGLMRAFDYAVTGKQQVPAMGEESGKVGAREQLEALKNIGIKDPPMYVLRQKEPRHRLNPFSMFRYIRDGIRLRKYNREWIKNNIR